MAVLVEHDTEAGVIYIRLAEGDVARTVEIDEMLMVDEDATGNPIGIEFLTALPPPHHSRKENELDDDVAQGVR